MAYPSSIDSYATLVDGVDDVLAADANSRATSIVSIETLLGTNAAQTTPVGTGRILNSTSASASTWTATPTITTSITCPLLVGGTAVGSTLTLQSTSGVGTTDAILFKVGNNGATEAGRITDAGMWLINDTTNAKMTVGLTINQGAAMNEILSFKNSNIAHGITGSTETNTYGFITQVGGGEGGLSLQGYMETTTAIQLFGAHTTDDTTKTTAGVGCINLQAALKSGTGTTVCGADANLLVIRNLTTTQFIFDAEGSGHQNLGTAWTEFDDYDDGMLLETLNATIVHDPIKGMFRKFTDENKEILSRNRIITYNDDGNHFINWSRANMLTIGAVRQLYKKFEEQALRITSLEQRSLTN